MPELISCKTLITYLYSKMRKSSAYGVFERVSKVARRFTLVTRILTYTRVAVTVIETSAVLILFAAMTVALIPLILIILAALAALDYFIGKRILKGEALENALARERVYIISGIGVFGEGFARELADSGAAVFVITASPTRRFICAAELNGVWYIRHAFYFRLKRRKLSQISDKTVYLI